MDYPGYKKTMDKFKVAFNMYKAGLDVEEISKQVGLKKKKVQQFLDTVSNLVVS